MLQEKNKKAKRNVSVFAIVFGSILALYALILIAILLSGVLTSLKTNEDFSIRENYLGLPRDGFTRKLLWPWQWEWANFSKIFKYMTVDLTGRYDVQIGMDMQILYTLLYAGGCAFLGTLCPFLVAYATTKFKYKFNKVIELVVLFAMIVPIVGTQVSMVSLMHKLHIYDTFWGLYMQKFGFVNMYYLVFVSVFKGVSREYYEAAHIDGASEWSVMVRVAFPLVITSFGLVFLIYFIQYWNDYQTLILYAPSHPSLSYALFNLMTNPSGADSTLNQDTTKMAGCIMIIVPVVVLFIIFRNKLMGNLSIGGVKE